MTNPEGRRLALHFSGHGAARPMLAKRTVRVTLVHNPKAGERRADGLPIVAALAAFGWHAHAVSHADLDEALRSPGDAVLVAGGDGTIGRVAKRMAGTGVPVGIIPLGTANNVARSLGIGVEARAAIDLLPRAVECDVDLGHVQTPRQAHRFLEGLGVGLLASSIAAGRREHTTLRVALDALASKLEGFPATRSRIEIDGRDASGEYLIAAVMNLRSLGPAIGLAPDARFDDGRLDVVLVRPEHRAQLLAHLQGVGSDAGERAPLPRFEVHRATHVLLGQSGWVHVDDRTHAFEGNAEVRVEPGAVRFLVPPTR